MRFNCILINVVKASKVLPKIQTYSQPPIVTVQLWTMYRPQEFRGSLSWPSKANFWNTEWMEACLLTALWNATWSRWAKQMHRWTNTHQKWSRRYWVPVSLFKCIIIREVTVTLLPSSKIQWLCSLWCCIWGARTRILWRHLQLEVWLNHLSNSSLSTNGKRIFCFCLTEWGDCILFYLELFWEVNH